MASSERLERHDFGGFVAWLADRFDMICFKLYAAVDQGPRSRHLQDLRELRSDRDELLAAARWTVTHDPSPGYGSQPGTGPRHLAFHPSGKIVFVINELFSTVTTFARDPEKGNLQELQTLSTLTKDFTGTNWSADIHVSPNRRFVYCSNRGHDSIAIFMIDPRHGTLTLAGHESTRGMTPRNFAIDPTGAFLLVANQKSDNIVVFRLDQKTGRLSSTGQVVEVPSPVCLKFTTPFL